MSHTAQREIDHSAFHLFLPEQPEQQRFLISDVKNNFICNMCYVLLNILKVKTCDLAVEKN
jgi:hypothetical protein